MTVDITDGILGLESIIRMNGSHLFNDLSAMPQIKLRRIPGLRSLPDGEDNREDITGRQGEVPYPSYFRGKTHSFEGTIIALNQKDLVATCEEFKSWWSERHIETLFEHVPHASYGSHHWGYFARCMACDIDEEVSVDNLHVIPSPYQRNFTASCRLSDGRYRLMTEDYTSLGNDSGDSIVANAQGRASADPIFTIHGVTLGEQIDLVNTSVMTSNGTARLRFFATAAGVMTVNFASIPRTVTIDTGSGIVDAILGFDSVYSQWWDEIIPGLLPGNNSIAVIGGTSWDLAFVHRTM